MTEEKKDENVEALLEKSLELIAPKMEAPITIELPEMLPDSTPTCSLIQPKPRKKFRWQKTIATELEKANEDVMPNPFEYTVGCANEVCGFQFTINSCHRPGTFGVDHDLRERAIGLGWKVVLRLSGALEYHCRRCQLKAA